MGATLKDAGDCDLTIDFGSTPVHLRWVGWASMGAMGATYTLTHLYVNVFVALFDGTFSSDSPWYREELSHMGTTYTLPHLSG